MLRRSVMLLKMHVMYGDVQAEKQLYPRKNMHRRSPPEKQNTSSLMVSMILHLPVLDDKLSVQSHRTNYA